MEKAEKLIPIHEELPDDIDKVLNDYLCNTDKSDGETGGEKETDEEEEEEIEEVENDLGFEDALKLFKNVIKFCSEENYPNLDCLFDSYNRIEEDWIKKKLNKLKQTKLDNHLNKNDIISN